MEANDLSGRMYSTMGSGMLGLKMSLHHHLPQQNPRHMPQPQHLPMVAYGHHEADHLPQAQQSVKQGYPQATKMKNQSLTLSDEDEAGPTEDSAGDGNRKASPWHRMKWTDSMVKLLIMAVYYIDDDAGPEGNDTATKKKGGSGVLQKKGKWKSVSRAMMERGFYVSPQQCEDKFNDLNKRYKRVNDILGKGTACRVVENQSLLDTMDHISLKMKEEVRKLLNSKHLFFREMCAYHNSGDGGSGNVNGGSSGGAHHLMTEGAAEPSQVQQQSQQQKCVHSSENAPIRPNSSKVETERSKMVKGGSGGEEDDQDDDDEDEDDEEVVEGGARGHEHGHDDEDDTDEKSSRKRWRDGSFMSASPLVQNLSIELKSVVQAGTKSSWEKRQWMKKRLMQLEEQRVGFQCQAYELEKQRLKWVKFRSKKEREIEMEKHMNERASLENERMVLLLRQKELELLDMQQQQLHSSNKMSDPSSMTG